MDGRTAVVLWLFGLGLVVGLGVLDNSLEGCTKDNLDIFIVLDGSRSIDQRNFERLRGFLSNLIGNFRVGEFESRIGLMQFSEELRTVIEFDFGKHKTTKGIQDNIKKLMHQNGSTTYTGHALKMANRKVFNGDKNDRADAEKVLLLITDGEAHDTKVALQEANKLKEKGVHLITIGAGSAKWINKFKYELSQLGSKPTHNHRVQYLNLQRITQKLVSDICNSKKRQPAPPHKCFQEKQDIVFMVDGTEKIGKRNFIKMKRFLQDFLSRLDIGPSRVRVGLIQFSDSHTTSIEIALNQYTSMEDVLAAVAKVMYQGGDKADLGNALRLVDLVVLNGRGGDRMTAPDTILIFTDGHYTDKDTVKKMIAKLRAKKTRVVSIAVGENEKFLNQDNIDALAMDTGNVYVMNTVKPSQFFDDMAPSTCKITTCQTVVPKCLPENQDILFMVDGSERIESVSFRYAQRYIKRLVSKMTLGRNHTQVGVVQYAGTGRIANVAVLGRNVLRSDVIERITRMKFKNGRGNSDLAYALKKAGEMIQNPKDQSRNGLSKTIVIITDGDIVDFTEAHFIAETLRNQGIRILTISNGKNSGREQFKNSLRLIASGPKEYYTLSNSYFNEVLKELQKTVCITEPEVPESCFFQKRNIFFVLDSSRGRGRRKFKEVKEFMETLVTKFHLGPSQTRVGFLQYDDPNSPRKTLVFDQNINDTAAQMLWRIQSMQYRKGKTSYLGAALKTVNDQVFMDGLNSYLGKKDVLIIISHSQISDAQVAFEEAEKLKDKGVEIISIATGNRKKVGKVKSQLQVISTVAANVRSADYTSLWNVVHEILVDICGIGKCPGFMATTCTPKKQDIVFVIDGSRSVGHVNFRRLQRFTTRLASRLDLAKDKTHLGLLQIGADRNTKYEFNLGQFPDRDDVLYMIKDMTYLDDVYTFLGSGLRKIRKEVFNKKGTDRPSVPDTLVLFTDGEAHDPHVMFKEAELLKKSGVKIISVGYGTNITLVNFRESLMKMATNAKDMFTIDFKSNDLVLEEKIDVVAKQLVEVDCPKGYSPPIECTQGLIDLFLLVDGSRSINPQNFRLVKKFLKKLVSEFDVGPNATHVGLLQFSDKKSMSYEFGFNENYNNKQVKRAIRDMEYKAGRKTLTGGALRIVDEYIFNKKNGDRPEAQDVIIVFTDGQAHDFRIAQKHAKAMKARKIRIITIAAGQETKHSNAKLIKQLEKIASSRLDVYTADFSELTDIVDKLIDIDCVIVQKKL